MARSWKGLKMKTKKSSSSIKAGNKKKNRAGGKISDKSKTKMLKNRHQMIEYAAYFHAEKRNFADGDPLKDWLLAEVEIDNEFNEGTTSK